jgi:3-oxoacyl-[acyl-carrier-protein] synthase II
LQHPDLAQYPYTVVGQVKEEQKIIDEIVPANKKRKTARFIHLAIVAADQAMKDAGFSVNIPESRDRFGTCIGVGIGGVDSLAQASIGFYNAGAKRVSPFLIPKTIINQAGAHISMMYNLQGSMSSVVNACSSSGDSVGLAFRMIRDGYADYMIAGGTESSIIPLSVAAFGNMRSLSSWKGDPQKACRPFDRDRSGFVMSEGAAILILEKMDFAKKRGAHIYAEIVGFGSTADAYHITAMHPEGRGAIKAIENALHDANVDHSKVGYINAHGTSTVMNDAIETMVIKKVFGKCPLVSSTKSMTGHMLGAAGGAEIAFTTLALQHQILPPTINLESPDPVCDLDYIAHDARDVICDYAISNSFGFGGGNAVVVLKRV